VDEYKFWAGVKENVIGVLGDNSRETVFFEGELKENFPDIKYF